MMVKGTPEELIVSSMGSDDVRIPDADIQIRYAEVQAPDVEVQAEEDDEFVGPSYDWVS